jgi:hypothetical protein
VLSSLHEFVRYLPTNLRGPEIAAELFASQNAIWDELETLELFQQIGAIPSLAPI